MNPSAGRMESGSSVAYSVETSASNRARAAGWFTSEASVVITPATSGITATILRTCRDFTRTADGLRASLPPGGAACADLKLSRQEGSCRLRAALSVQPVYQNLRCGAAYLREVPVHRCDGW